MSELYNPWTVVNLVFRHLAEEGLHPVLGESGDPSEPAEALLLSFGIQPGDPGHGDGHLAHLVRDELTELRTLLGTPVDGSAGSPGEGRGPDRG
jgi:hypothetical protein